MIYHVLFKGDVNKELLENLGVEKIKTFKYLKRIAIVETDLDLVDILSEENEILKIEIDGDDNADVLEDSSESQGEGYNIELMEVEKFHEEGIKGQGVKVAVFDGGCQPHEDLIISGGYNGFDPSKPYMKDYGGHGTHVAGIIGMRDNGKGYLGVAPECELYIVKLNNDTGGGLNRSAQISSMEWCIENNISVVNCSFSGDTDSAIRREIFRVASEEYGIFIVASSGNGQRGVPLSESTIRYPALYDFSITVGNIDENKKRYVSSSVGDDLTFVSGGVNIMSCGIDNSKDVSDKYVSKTGTSMSSPSIAGLIALYIQKYPDKSKSEILEIMMDNAESLGDKREYGVGLPKYPSENKNIQMREYEDEFWYKIFPITKAINVQTMKGGNLESILSTLGAKIGHTSTGSYVRFDNGLIIQWSQNMIKQKTNKTHGSIYRSDTHFWQLPYPVNPNFPVFCSASCSSNTRWADISGTTSTGNSFPVRQFSGVKYETDANTNTLLVGMWK